METKPCGSVHMHAQHDVLYVDDDLDDFTCPGITTEEERVEALERRVEEAREIATDLYEARQRIDELEKQVEYHREQHGIKSRALNEATTSPDTKAAYENGWRSGFARAQQQMPPNELERGIDMALVPALQKVADLEQQSRDAALALNAAYTKVNALFNPPPPDPDEEEEPT